MTILLFTCGLALSAVAAYYSVMGLIAIFSTAVVPIAIMGSILEASKLVSASWLYRNWTTIPKLLKIYFTTAVFVLMVLTSMGIFGYLSKAHLDQAVPTGDVASKVAILDEKIKTQKENIDAARKAISQLDSQVDQTLSRSSDERGAANAVAIRQRQAKERASLFAEIGKSQAEIAKLNEERAPVASELRKVEAEVGPIKYIAALIYGDTLDDTLLESSVRIVILMIVFVFDPLAVLLLIAANREMMGTVEDEKDEAETQAWFERAKQRAKFWDSQKRDFVEDPQPIYVADVTMPEPDEEPDDTTKWESVVADLTKDRTSEKVKEEESKWEIPKPPAEVPEEFRKVVDEYFNHEEQHVGQPTPMLYVNEEPEKFLLNPDFDEKDAFQEKRLIPVRPNSRRAPPQE